MAVNKAGDINDPKEIKTRQELAYEFVAKYSDGTLLKQYDEENGSVHHFGHIAQDKIVEFILVSKFKPTTEISVNLITGLFSINGKKVLYLQGKNTKIPLGLLIENRSVISSWGNKAKLIYTRHIRRDFNMGTGTTQTTILYELGWEADVDGKREKHTIVLQEGGRFAIPPNEYEGFKSL